MKRQTVIDISKYVLQRAEKSFCPCGEGAFLLIERKPDRDAPAFYLCAACGRVAQAGVGEVAPPEEDRIPKGDGDGAVFGEEAKSACEASRRSMRMIRLEEDLDAAYAELRKLRPSLTAVFDREVHERAKAAGERRRG